MLGIAWAGRDVLLVPFFPKRAGPEAGETKRRQWRLSLLAIAAQPRAVNCVRLLLSDGAKADSDAGCAALRGVELEVVRTLIDGLGNPDVVDLAMVSTRAWTVQGLQWLLAVVARGMSAEQLTRLCAAAGESVWVSAAVEIAGWLENGWQLLRGGVQSRGRMVSLLRREGPAPSRVVEEATAATGVALLELVGRDDFTIAPEYCAEVGAWILSAVGGS